MKKTLAFVPALGMAVLPFLSQLTVSGSTVALEETEITSITDGVVNGLSSMFNMTTGLFTPAVIIAVVGVIIGVIGGFSRLRNKLGSRRRR